MKKLIAILCSLALFLSITPGFSAFAAETGGGDEAKKPSNVNITVVMPEPAPEQVPEPAVLKVYPSDVSEIRDKSGWQIVKTYELNTNENPEDIPRESFERNGWKFTLTDITRKETANAQVREHTETVTLNTSTKELEQILPQLAPTMEYRADDGSAGILSLDISSIKVETAGTKTSTYTLSVTREYPHLSASDTSLVPKTVEDKGKTYTLAGVDWKAGNTVTVDYDALPEYYTAVATYTASGKSTKVTGYTTTAAYKGTLAKLSQGKTIYTAYFLGEEIRTTLEMTEPAPDAAPKAATSPDLAQKSGEANANGAWLAIIPLAVILACGAYYYMKRKETQNAKTHHSDAVAASDGGDGGSGSGG